METEQNYPETTFRDYLRVLFRQKAVIFAAVITVLGTVYIGLKLKTNMYEAQVKVLISASKMVESPFYRDLLGLQNVQMALTQSEVVKSSPVIDRAVRVLGLAQKPLDYERRFCSPLKALIVDFKVKNLNKKLEQLKPEQKQAYFYRMAIEDLRANIKVEPVRDTNVFTISAKDYSPVGAAIIANVVSRSYVIFDLEQQLAELQMKYGEKHLMVTQLKDNIGQMTKRLTGEPIPDMEAIGPASVKIIEQANVPIEPVGPKKLLIGILALFMSMFLGVMLAFAFEYMDQTFKSPQDVERYLNLPFLGSIPKKRLIERALIKNGKRMTRYVKFYQTLAEQMYLILKDKKLKSVLITATVKREGATTIIANLGMYLANKLGHKVLLIDANLRKPGLHSVFKASESVGLANTLEGQVPFEAAVKGLSSNLYLLPAGKTQLNPITLLDSSKMTEVLKAAAHKYEIILVDCADLRDYKDAVVISLLVDGVAFIVSEGKIRRQVVQASVAPLRDKKVNVLGAILSNRTFAIPSFVYDRV